MAYAALTHLYFAARFGGRWVDSDTADLRVITDLLWQDGQVPPPTTLYTSATGYPMYAGFTAQVLGVSTAHFQQVVHPMIGLVLVCAALFLARRLTSDPTLQALAVFLVAASPEILFETSRGSHGAFTQAAVLFVLAALIPLMKARRADVFPWVLLVSLFFAHASILNFKRALIAGSIFIAPLLLMTVRFAIRRRPDRRSVSAWLVAPALVLVAALFFVNEGFSTAPDRPLGILLEQTGKLLTATGEEDTAGSAGGRPAKADTLWGYMQTAWGSPIRYALFALWNPIVPVAALVGWVFLAKRIFGRTGGSDSDVVLWSGTTGLGLWLAAILFGSIVLGILHFTYPLRMFAFTAMGFAFLAAMAFQGVSRSTWRRPVAVGAVCLIAWLAVAAPLKATSEPAINQHWRFYSAEEGLALEWLSSRPQAEPFWIAGDDPGWKNRLGTAFAIVADPPNFAWIHFSDPATTFFDSGLARDHAARLEVPWPDTDNYSRTYDNGDVAYYVDMF